MQFNSPAFAIFFILTFALSWYFNKKSVSARNFFLLAASWIFYGYWDWRFLLLLILSGTTDYYLGNTIHRAPDHKRKNYLILSIIFNLAILSFFKYFNFFADSLRASFDFIGLQPDFVTLEIILPVGISFYTFQSLSYTIEIYRRKMEPSPGLFTYLSFVSFFPQLAAGPIERAYNLLPQFYTQKTFDGSRANSGLRLVLWGLFKKIVIADTLAQGADAVFNDPSQFQGLAAMGGVFCFAIQIYCDFSGYSDIAIGTARLLGFDLNPNFKTPYFSKSIREFWTRWHISLSTWFKEYVYIPLGGNRRGEPRQLLNLMITFLLSGLWHGASWMFVIWGALHGTAMCIETVVTKGTRIKITPPVSNILLFLFVCFAWIFFRANSMQNAGILIDNIFSTNFLAGFADWTHTFSKSPRHLIFVLLSLLILFATELKIKTNDFDTVLKKFPKPIRWSVYYVLAIWITLFGAFDAPPAFIYFQF